MSEVVKDDQRDLSDRIVQKKDMKVAEHLITTSRLRFFAPAHLGVLAAGKLGVAMSVPILDRMVGAYLGSNPLFQNLRHDSPTILDLRKATEQLYEQHKISALRACSLFGTHEEMVYVGAYAHDEKTRIEPDHYHQSICKPNIGYLKPLEFAKPHSQNG